MKSRKEIVVHAVRWPRATNAANVCGTSSKSLTNEPGTTNGCMLNETTAVLVLSNDRCLTSECEMVLLSQFPTSCRLRRTFWSSAIGVVSLSLLRAHATANSRHRILTKAMAISSLGREEGEVQSIRNEFRETFTKCSGSVTLEKLSPGLLALRLSNRDKRNALSPSMMVELLARVEEVEAACVTEKDSDGSPYGLILTGSHGTFCSGFDLSAASEHFQSPEMGNKMCTLMQHIYSRFRSLPILTIAAIDGFALGGGAELTTWPDWRVLSENGKIQFVQGRMGVTPGWGGGSRLTELLGPAKALQFLSGSAPIMIENGRHLGYIDYIAKEKFAEQFAKDVLEGFLANTQGSVDTLRGFKSVILNAQRHDKSLEQKLIEEREIFASLWGAKDNLKALARAQEKKSKRTS